MRSSDNKEERMAEPKPHLIPTHEYIDLETAAELIGVDYHTLRAYHEEDVLDGFNDAAYEFLFVDKGQVLGLAHFAHERQLEIDRLARMTK
jgi:hypothetical protein